MTLDVVSADLAGNLADCRPLALLCFLAGTRKSGVLRVRGPRSEATVWLCNGAAVGAEGAGSGTVLDTVVDALRTPKGEFTFEQCDVRSPEDVPPAMDALLDRAIEALRTWQELSEAIPSMSLVIHLQQTGEAEVSLSSAAWTVSVTVAAGHATPAAVAAHLGWPALRTCRAVKELVDAGRARLEAPPRLSLGTSTAAAGPGRWDPGRQPMWPGANAPTRFRIGWSDAEG